MFSRQSTDREMRGVKATLCAWLLALAAAPALAAPPYVVSPIGSFTKDEDDGPATIGLDSVFKEDDGDTVTYAIDANDNPSIVSLAIVGGKDLEFTFVPDQNGEANITVSATDLEGTATDTFVLKLDPKNDQPIVVGPDPLPRSVAEDSGTTAIPLGPQIADVDLGIEGDTHVYSELSNSNMGLLGVNVTGSTLEVTPAADQSGSATIRIEVRDLAGATATFEVDVLVTPENDAPTLASPIPNQLATEDGADVSVSLAGVFDDVDVGDSFTYAVTSSDPSKATVTESGGTVTVALVPDANGDVTITVTATDTGGASVADAFDVSITPENDAPTLASPLADQAAAEDGAALSLSLAGVFDDVDAGDTLSYLVTSSDPSKATVTESGGTVTVALVPDANGGVTITVTATDTGGASAVDAFDLSIAAVNDAPTVANPIPDQSAPEDSGAVTIDLSAVFQDVDVATNGQTLSYSASSSNVGLVSASAGGATLTLSLVSNGTGTATITVTATDTGLPAASVSDSFVLTVTNVNDPPTVASPPAPIVLAEDASAQSVSMAGVFADIDPSDTLTLSAGGATNPALFAAAPTFAGTSLQFTLAPNQNGTSAIPIRATDSQGAFVDTAVSVTVTAVNDAPYLANDMLDRTVAEDSAPIVIDLANVFDDVDIATNGDSLSFVASTSDAALASVAVSGSTLTITLGADLNGVATISVTATDVASATTSDSFVLTVDPVDDTPVASDDAAVMDEDAGAIAIDVLANDYLAEQPTVIESAGTTLNIAGVDYPESSESTPTPAFDGVGSYVTLPNGTVRIVGSTIEYAPREHFSGTDYFTYTIRDSGGATATGTVNITINSLNDPPLARTGTITYSVIQGQVLTILADGGLIDHGWDPDEDSFSVVQETTPDSILAGYTGTTLSLNPDGSFVYTPDVAFVGTDRFEIRFFDGTAASGIVEVFVEVTPAPPPPPPPPPGEVEFDFDLADVPLEDAISAEANVLVIMDDSGSMDWAVMTPGVQGEFWITNGGVKDNSVRTSTRSYRYIIPAPTNVYGNADVVPTEAALAASTNFTGNNYGVWRARNAQYNTVYYNPTIMYSPWVGLDRNGNEFGNVNPTAAPYDPYAVPLQTINLLNTITYTSSSVPKTRNGGTNANVTNNNVYIPAYYTTTATGIPAWNDAHTLVEIRNNGTTYAGGPMREDCATDDGNPLTCTYAQEIQNFANWFTYYRSREYTSKAALGRAVADASNIRLGYVVLNDSNERTRIDTLNASFRVGHKRTIMHQIYKVDSNDGTPLRIALDRAGKHFECKVGDSFGSTTNSSPGSAACPVSPAPEGQCQNNFALLFSDGTWNENFNLRGNEDATGLVNSAFDGGKFGDTYSRSLADVAMYYYERDLQPTLLDGVPTTELDINSAPAGAFGSDDEVMHQHMKTYTVGFGIEGLVDPDVVYSQPYGTPFAWSDPFDDGPAKVDDMLHAALNGRGRFLQANNPVLLSQAFQEAFEAFSEGSVSVSAVAFNSTALREETVEYRGFFNLKYNTGDLRALRVDPSDGTVDNDNPIWRAAETLDTLAPTNRVIFTYDRLNDQGVPFRHANLNADQRAQMSLAEVNYIRGDRSNEEPSGVFRARPDVEGILGDIVHSAPVYVGGPRAIRRDQPPYPTDSGELYSAFKSSNAGRRQIVYVGANDGMVHGFDASTGDEVMGFVPNKLIDSTERFSNDLDLLTSLTYSHKFFVDVTPTIEDVYMPPSKSAIGKEWTTVMVGALGGGGKGYYALNVTTPDSSFTSEANASNTVLWEFTDRDDTYPVDINGDPLGGAVNSVLDLSGRPVKDLGYSYSPAQIAMSNLNDGGSPAQRKWVSVFGNGYNSTAGIATLFVLPIEDGLDGWSSSDVVKLTTGEGVKSVPDALAGLPNGLGVPALIDKDLNGTVDLVYAGDLFGYMYRFDISDPDPDNWTVTKIFQATYGTSPVVRQPITTQPFVRKHPSGTGYLVIFGTGSYVTEGDGTSNEIQSVYGIWDRLDTSPPTANANAKATRLVEQTITNIVDETSFAFDRLRYASNNAVNYTPDSGVTPGVYGWYFDLDMVRPDETVQGNPNPDTMGEAPPAVQYPGERAIRRMVPRGSALLVTTVIPRDENTCSRSPPGSTFPIDPVTGGTPTKPILDLNNDGVIDGDDMVTVGGVAYAAGILFDTSDLNGTLVDPSLLLGSGDTDFLFLSGGDEQITLRIAGAEDPKTGRLSWRELEDAN